MTGSEAPPSSGRRFQGDKVSTRDLSDLEQALEQASKPPVDPHKHVDALVALAWELRSADTPRANELSSKARLIAKEHNYTLGQARASRVLAMSIVDSDGLRRVFSLSEEAMALFDKAGDTEGRAASRDFLASLCEHVGDLTAGLSFALDALSIAREHGDPVRIGFALSSVGGILSLSGDVEAAVEHLNEALGLFESVEDTVGTASITTRLATAYRKLERNDEALRYAELSCRLGEQLGNHMITSEALFNMAAIKESNEHLDEAIRLYRASYDALPEGISRDVVGPTYMIALGRVLTAQGQVSEAETALLAALRLVEGESVSIQAEADAHEALAALYERLDRPYDTIRHLRSGHALRGRIAEREASNKVAQVETKFAMDAAKKDAEIQRLRYVELRDMQAKLVEAEKMSVLGRIAAGTAHELNTPVGVLRSNAQLTQTAIERLLQMIAPDRRADAMKLAAVLKTCRSTSDEAMARLCDVTDHFRRFTQLDAAQRRPFDLREGLESALALLEPNVPDRIRIERQLGPIPTIEGWPQALNHAFLTVLQNAVQAIDAEGVITVQTRAHPGEVSVLITDTGRGMSESQVSELFEVGWSSHGTRTRLRLGLSAAYATVQRHGGRIEVDSELNRGTTFAFRFVTPIDPKSTSK